MTINLHDLTGQESGIILVETDGGRHMNMVANWGAKDGLPYLFEPMLEPFSFLFLPSEDVHVETERIHSGALNDEIASENFKPKFLSKTNMARNAQDAAIATNIQILQWQAVKNGRKLIPVSPAYTTQTCSECGEIANPPIGLKVRTYRCQHCGMVKDRDKNAALNMLIRAGLVPEAHRTVRRHPGATPETHVPSKLRIPRL